MRTLENSSNLDSKLLAASVALVVSLAPALSHKVVLDVKVRTHHFFTQLWPRFPIHRMLRCEGP